MSPEPGAPLRIFVVAGEHSGDRLGAGLMRALRSRLPSVEFHGIGGDAMVAEGLRPIFPLADIAVMGFVPVLAKLPTILARIARTVEAVIATEPALLIVIDSPDFTHRVARRVRRRAPHIPIVDYVSPTVWAWRPGRAKAMRVYVDHVLALLPFEPEAHARLSGPPCSYVGHPLIEKLDVLRPDPIEAEAREQPCLLVLPGSRRSEIRRLTADFGAAVALLAAKLGSLDVLLPAVGDLASEIEARVADWPVRPTILLGESAKWAAFRRARAALAASGTVTLELALAQVPMVVAYKVSPFETWLKHVVTVPSIVLPNLILGDNVIPEFIQDRCTPQALASALEPLMRQTPQRSRQLKAFARLDLLTRLPDGVMPSDRAAEIVCTLLPKPNAEIVQRR